MVRGGLAEGVQKGSPGGVQTELGGVQTGPNRAGRANSWWGGAKPAQTQEMGQKSLLELKSGREGPKVGPDGGIARRAKTWSRGQIWREMGQTGQKLPYGGKWAIWVKPEL